MQNMRKGKGGKREHIFSSPVLSASDVLCIHQEENEGVFPFPIYFSLS
jgi:hypothetical protein